jgi:UDP-N-acetylmuramyl pentapeptide phosphotransferase/UDP-N-acetylglucosamine-1-phosphate transferase
MWVAMYTSTLYVFLGAKIGRKTEWSEHPTRRMHPYGMPKKGGIFAFYRAIIPTGLLRRQFEMHPCTNPVAGNLKKSRIFAGNNNMTISLSL